MHGGRIAREVSENGRAAGAKYAAALLISGTLFGALALQLKEIVQGRERVEVAAALGREERGEFADAFQKALATAKRG
jgi:hypothetical protein